MDRLATGKEAVIIINDSLSRKKGTFVLAKESLAAHHAAMLFTGAPTVAQTKNGYVITLGLSREQVERLRDMCTTLLDEDKS